MKWIIGAVFSLFISIGVAFAQEAPKAGDAGYSNLFCTEKGAEIVYEAFGTGNEKFLKKVGEECFRGPFVPVIVDEVVKNQIDYQGDRMWMLKVGEDSYIFLWTAVKGEDA